MAKNVIYERWIRKPGAPKTFARERAVAVGPRGRRYLAGTQKKLSEDVLLRHYNRVAKARIRVTSKKTVRK